MSTNKHRWSERRASVVGTSVSRVLATRAKRCVAFDYSLCKARHFFIDYTLRVGFRTLRFAALGLARTLIPTMLARHSNF